MVKCISIKGNIVEIPREKMVLRASVYAIIIHNKKILMITSRSNGKFFFPGGGVNIGEKSKDALKREVKEEAGIEIKIQKFLYFNEQFFYWDPGDEAYHSFNFFYICKPLTTKLIDDNKVDDEEATKPRWVDLEEVRKNKNNLKIVKEVLELL